MKLAAALLALTLSLGAAPALAWNAHGHMVISAIAWERMTPKARERADALLKLNSDYGLWTLGVDPAVKAKTAFMRASNWPDVIRTAPGYANDTIDGPAASQNIGYADKRVHPYWHYKDRPFAIGGAAGEPAHTPNAETQILAFRKALAAKSSSEDVKSYDLIWLAHLVADVHQPLHAVSRYAPATPKGDNRGGAVLTCPIGVLQCAQPRPASLHFYWDAALGAGESALDAERMAQGLKPAARAKVRLSEPSAWLGESYELAKTTTYASPIGDGVGPYTLTEDYAAKASVLAKERAALAGARLADLLNKALR